MTERFGAVANDVPETTPEYQPAGVVPLRYPFSSVFHSHSLSRHAKAPSVAEAMVAK